MSATTGIIGKGTLLGHSPDGTTYTTIAEVVDVKMPELNMAKADFTNYTSPNSHMEYLPTGWLETSDVEFDLTYVTAETAILVPLVGSNIFWKITLPDTHTWIFKGFISKLGGEIPNKDRINQKIIVTVTAKPAYA